jgi:hypothetical protein
MNEKDVYAEMKANRNSKKVLTIFESIETDAKLSLYVQELRHKYPNLLCAFEQTDVKGIRPTHFYQQLLINILEYYKRESTFEVSATGQHYLVKIPESKMNINP